MTIYCATPFCICEPPCLPNIYGLSLDEHLQQIVFTAKKKGEKRKKATSERRNRSRRELNENPLTGWKQSRVRHEISEEVEGD